MGLIVLYVLMVRRNNVGQCLHGGLLGIWGCWPHCGISGSSTWNRALGIAAFGMCYQNSGRLGLSELTSSCVQLNVRGADRPD